MANKVGQEAAATVKNSLSSTLDLERMLRNLVQTVIRGNAEVAAEREQALVLTTSRAKSQIEELSILASDTGASIAELKESIVRRICASHIIRSI